MKTLDAKLLVCAVSFFTSAAVLATGLTTSDNDADSSIKNDFIMFTSMISLVVGSGSLKAVFSTEFDSNQFECLSQATNFFLASVYLLSAAALLANVGAGLFSLTLLVCGLINLAVGLLVNLSRKERSQVSPVSFDSLEGAGLYTVSSVRPQPGEDNVDEEFGDSSDGATDGVPTPRREFFPS